MQESMRSVLASPIGTHVPQVALDGIVCIQILQVFDFGIAQLCGRFNKRVLGAVGSEGAFGDIDRAIMPMMLLFAATMVGFKLCDNERSETIGQIASRPEC